MKKALSITLTLLLVLFAGKALAEREDSRSIHNSERSEGSRFERPLGDRGDRIERHLDLKGDRIERRFDRKAAFFAEQGKYRKAHHFERKGNQIDRRLDRKGERINSRFDRREYNQGERDHRYRSYARAKHHARNYRQHKDNYDQRPYRQHSWRSRGWNH